MESGSGQSELTRLKPAGWVECCASRVAGWLAKPHFWFMRRTLRRMWGDEAMRDQP
jgi:hypothetical protein